jgi:spore coat polysaccharide biosynthesis predicted glycosyltransferase SpsG
MKVIKKVSMLKQIYNICEGGGSYGMGHVVRSFSFCNIIQIESKVQSYIKINIDIKETEKVNFFFTKYSLCRDEKSVLKQIPKHSTVILDGYHFDIELVNRLSKKLDWRVIFISDVHTIIPNCEVLINHLPYVKESSFRSEIGKKLFGVKYAILREPFYQKPNNHGKDRILICLGNSNVSGDIINIYKALLKLGMNSSMIDVIFQSKIEEIPDQNIHININASKVHELISNAELCFITPGNISYEVFSINRNCILGSISETQVTPAQEFDKMGVCVNVGKWASANFSNLENWIDKSIVTSSNQKTYFSALSIDNLKNELSYLNL